MGTIKIRLLSGTKEMRLRTKILIILLVIAASTIYFLILFVGGVYLSNYISTANERKVESRESESQEFLFSQLPFLNKLPSNTITRKNFTPQGVFDAEKDIQSICAHFDILILFPPKDIVILATSDVG